MATLEDFLKTGHLGPVVLGMSPVDAMTALGDPDDTSRKSNPLLIRYGCVQLSFWRAPQQKVHQLREIAVTFQPNFEMFPESLDFTDWNPTEAPTEEEFRSFIEQIDYPPSHVIEGASEKAFSFLSGVSALVAEGRLHSLRLQQKESKPPTDAAMDDRREPSLEQIHSMLLEAEHALGAGTLRGALLIGWAGMEAILRRLATKEGRQGKVGVPPHILLRELISSGRLHPLEHGWLEATRQMRTATVHGLAPVPLDCDVVSRLIDTAYRLLEVVTEKEREKAPTATVPSF